MMSTIIIQGNHNNARIMRAGVMAGALTEAEVMEYLTYGRMPEVHTFDEWNKEGRAVKKGERKAFSAVIWVPKTRTTETEEGEEETLTNFRQHTAYFFRKEQTEEITYADVKIPADVIREVKKGVEYLTGNTRPIKEALKAANYRWSRKKSAWYRPVAR